MAPQRVRQIGGTILVVATAVLAGLQFHWSEARGAERARENDVSAAIVKASSDGKKPAPTEGLRAVATVIAERPLDSGIFLRAGLLRAGAGDLAGGRSLIREALRRDPRSKPTRFWLLLDAIKLGYNQQALAQIDRLMAVDPQHGSAYFPLMAALARDPAAVPKLHAMFAAKPLWGSEFLNYLSQQKADPGLIFALLNGSGGAEVSPSQAALITSLVAQRDYDRAYLTWVNLLPKQALANVEPIYDGGFEGLPGIAPFNWSLTQNDIATATIERSAGLVIDYSGETATPLAEQTILLDPQSYRLTYAAQGESADENAKQVTLRILCLPDRNPILERPIEVGGTHAIDFTVPATCAAQLLAIEGTPGEFAGLRQVTIRNIAVTAR